MKVLFYKSQWWVCCICLLRQLGWVKYELSWVWIKLKYVIVEQKFHAQSRCCMCLVSETITCTCRSIISVCLKEEVFTAPPTPKSSKISMLYVLCSVSKLSTSYWKIIYASYSTLFKELKNSIKIKVGQMVFELLIQNQNFDCFGINFITAWRTKISIPFLSSFNNSFIDA